MRVELRSFRRWSLTAQLISTYLIILAVGGLVTSLVGSYITSRAFMDQARRTTLHDLAAARAIYDQQLQLLARTVEQTAAGRSVQEAIISGDRAALVAHLDALRREGSVDFIAMTDRQGRVTVRPVHPDRIGDDVRGLTEVRIALAGQPAAGTEILSAERLAREDTMLPARARIELVSTPHSREPDRAAETAGLALVAASPVRVDGRVVGALYAGVLLNRATDIVDRVWDLVYSGERFRGRNIGSVTIFQKDVRIATNVRNGHGERALGTRVSAEVEDAVLKRGQIWNARAFVVKDWYISAYEPIRNYDGDIVGMLHVGLLQKLFVATRNQVILSFFIIASLGFAAIIGVTYIIIRRLTHPLVEMAAVTRGIAAGDFDQEVRTESPGEIGLLAESLNTMVHSLRDMKHDLEEWGRTLEEKVRQRSEELVAMQGRVAQSERLASLGMLSAGVAHEINNPLGGILALTSLTLEDLPADDVNRENLEEVVRQTERCRNIVRGLLEFSRQAKPAAESVDVNEVLQNTLSLIKNQALFFNVDVVKNWDAALPPVAGDRSQLQQVFMNLLVNAAQAMDERGTITIATRYDVRVDQVEICIADTGRGIPPELIGRVFDPFFTTKESGRGTGLGLSIVYGIVTKHGGTIAIDSTVGKGTTFTLRFPAAPVVAEEAVEAEAVLA